MNDESGKRNEAGFGTTGHEWDGIEEWNNPLPRWWLWTFYATCIWGLIYTIAYPAWPLVNRATAGFLGFSTRAQLAESIENFEAGNAGLREELAVADVVEVAAASGSELHGFAVQVGASVFRNHCSQCHGAGAAGVKASGYPNLRDDAWLWGGTAEEIAYTVAHGIRNEQSPDARWSEMSAYLADGILDEEQIRQVANHVLLISGQEHDATLASAGEKIFLDECSACHMEDGTGDASIGAPDLTDAIWLYGGDEATIVETVSFSRFGVMPAWSEEHRSTGGLGPDEVNAVAIYVHQLGGGR